MQNLINFGNPPPRPAAKIRLRRSIIITRLGGQPDAADIGEEITVADTELRQLDPADFDFLGRVEPELAFDI